jgi:hypothetical protein
MKNIKIKETVIIFLLTFVYLTQTSSCQRPNGSQTTCSITQNDTVTRLESFNLYKINSFSTFYKLFDTMNYSEAEIRAQIDEEFLNFQSWWYPVLFDASGDSLYIAYPVSELDYEWVRGYSTKTRLSDSGWIFSTYPYMESLYLWKMRDIDIKCLSNSGLRNSTDISNGKYAYMQHLTRFKDNSVNILLDIPNNEVILYDSDCTIMADEKVPFNCYDNRFGLSIIENDNYVFIDHEFYKTIVIEKSDGSSRISDRRLKYFAGCINDNFYYLSSKGYMICYNPLTNVSQHYQLDITEIDAKSSFCIDSKRKILYIALLSAKTDCLFVYAYQL